MDGLEVKKVMEQVHISAKMQEDIIMNVQKRMENGNKKVWNWRKVAAVAAAFALTACVASIPVSAYVTSVVKERMEEIPKEELEDLNDMIQGQAVLADGFSREYSVQEEKRYNELWQAYKDGTFPVKVIVQVDKPEEVTAGTLCYIRSTGVFNLPDGEMTDEELLEIIDFQNKMSYAVIQSNVITEEEKAAYQAEEARLKKLVQDANGISGSEAVEIAEKQIKVDLGDRADKLELMTDSEDNAAELFDTTQDWCEGIESKAGVAYNIGFGDPNDRSFTCGYIIDAVDGSILQTW